MLSIEKKSIKLVYYSRSVPKSSVMPSEAGIFNKNLADIFQGLKAPRDGFWVLKLL